MSEEPALENNERPTHPPLRELARGLALGIAVGIVCGVASAAFLVLLDYATERRRAHVALVFALPLAGLVIGLLYERYGAPIARGNDLVIDTIHDGGPRLPLRMAPMVLLGTVLTHLFGGSAGREGTAVQMGASLADAVGHRLSAALRRQILVAGVAGGFGSVFGTPLAGAIFGLEVVVIGRVEYDAFLPALCAALVGDLTTRALGVVHTRYEQAPALALSPRLLLAWLGFAAAIALCAYVFVELTHRLKKLGVRFLPRLPLRMALGGAIVIALWRLAGTDDYLGLGVPMIEHAFVDGALPREAFLGKLLFTALTLSAGFLGGEVTPLFFVGATLGNVLARILDVPIALGAGVGMAALFGAAANTPLALTVMAAELLGGNVLPHVAIVCVLSYVLSGRRGIYAAQR